MQIEIRLKKILRDHDLDGHGVIQRIAGDLDVHRHTIGKIYRNQLTNPSLDILGKLCEWLVRNGVPGDILPWALLGPRPSKLRVALLRPASATLFVAMYRQMEPPARTWRWIAQHDAVAMANMMQFLSSSLGTSEQPPGKRQPTIDIEYVSFRFEPGKITVNKELHEKDKMEAMRIYRNMRAQRFRRSSILIGSQRVNHMVEIMVAELFGCEPFVARENQNRIVPLHLTYRKDDLAVRSCFGSRKAPPGYKDSPTPGIYYLDERDEKETWIACPWKQAEHDAGVVIIVCDPGSDAMEMAVFGFSGLGTEAVGAQFLRDADVFWPLTDLDSGKQAGIFIFRVCLAEDESTDGVGDVRPRDIEVIPLNENILKKLAN